MHLRGYPKYYVKGDERRAVYYTAEATELRSLGWTPEEQLKVEATEEQIIQQEKTEVAPEPERIEVSVVEDDHPEVEVQEGATSPVFEFMTKPELLQYALDRGVDLPNNMLKAEIIKTCKQLSDA